MADNDDFVKEMERLTEDAKGPQDKPRAGRPTTKEKNAAKKASTPSYRAKPLKPRIEGFVAGLGMIVYARDQVCGQVIAEHAGNIAEAYSAWADTSPRVRAMLEKLLSGGAGTEAFMSMVPVLVVVLVHHNVLPQGLAQRLPIVTPEANGHVPSAADTEKPDAPPVL